MPKITKYGITGSNKNESYALLDLEFEMLRRGGKYKNEKGEEFGLGMFEHFMIIRKMLWPRRWRHKWVDLIYKEIIEHTVTILMGSFSSGKTSIGSEYALIYYWLYPETTMVLVSTTSVDKLKSAVFAEILMLFKSARERFPWLAGNPLDFKCAITTDKLDEENDIRSMRKGIFGKSCYEGKQYVGLGTFAGIKQDRIFFLADELQFMAPTFFDCLPNMFGSVMVDANNQPQIKIVGSGNPKHDSFDQLGRAAEPKTGWASIGMIEKTTCWDTNFENGRCVNLIGTDGPNFDVPQDVPIPYPRLVNRSTIKNVETKWGRDSLKFNEQCVGRMMIGFAGNRVITMELCRKHGALDRAIWAGTDRTSVAAFDPAFTESGDRCVFSWGEFGMSNLGIQILRYGGHMIIPLVGGTDNNPDEQTVSFVKARAKELGIPAQNIFYGSTGRGTTGAACSKIFVTPVPVPIAEGGICSARPVRHDLFIEEEIGNRIIRRLKRCDEEYSKFITEIWFSTRNVIECGQMRELPEEAILEGCARQYTTVMGGRIEVESKDEMKETLGFSPDIYDTFGFMVEGARQLGFKIQRLGEDAIVETSHEPDWLELEKEKFRSVISSAMLSH